jgi:hypothetical protein
VEQAQRQTWLTTCDVKTGKGLPMASFYHFLYTTSFVALHHVVNVKFNLSPLCHHCFTNFAMLTDLNLVYISLYTLLQPFYYVSSHALGPILSAASHGQRPHLSYQTITLSDQSTSFGYGFFTIPAPTRLDTSVYYTPSTGHSTIGLETYATTGSQKPSETHITTS